MHFHICSVFSGFKTIRTKNVSLKQMNESFYIFLYLRRTQALAAIYREISFTYDHIIYIVQDSVALNCQSLKSCLYNISMYRHQLTELNYPHVIMPVLEVRACDTERVGRHRQIDQVYFVVMMKQLIVRGSNKMKVVRLDRYLALRKRNELPIRISTVSQPTFSQLCISFYDGRGGL